MNLNGWNAFIERVDVDSLSPNLLVGLLCATLRAKSKLPSRANFYKKIQQSLENRDLLEDNLLGRFRELKRLNGPSIQLPRETFLRAFFVWSRNYFN